jgi:hypothetical protein
MKIIKYILKQEKNICKASHKATTMVNVQNIEELKEIM